MKNQKKNPIHIYFHFFFSYLFKFKSVFNTNLLPKEKSPSTLFTQGFPAY